MKVSLLLLLAFLLVCEAPAQEARKVPPAGIVVPDDVAKELTEGVAALGKKIEDVRGALKTKPALAGLLPDVRIFHKAVDWALRYNEFFDAKQFAAAKTLLAKGTERAEALVKGQAPWNSQTGLVVRGYESRIDGSIQPYGLVVPEGWKAGDKTPVRLDIWLHGRSEKLSELAFVEERMRNKGEFVPAGAIVLHLYGRFCNANKFAGETDLFEALADVRKYYAVDENRLVVRGFSMGGAACWHFGTHYAGLWAAVAPGAGFSETPAYSGAMKGKEPPPAWEQTLWRWYDSTGYARNLFNTTTVAYSGELDKQKQAADMMAKALLEDAMELRHIIGPGTEHKYHPDSKKEIDLFVDAAAAKGREELPPKVRFTTYTLRYPRMEWVTIDGLDKHWERAEVDAELVEGSIRATTKNVAALTFEIRAPGTSLDRARPPRVTLDGQELAGPPVASPWIAHFRKTGDRWAAVRVPEAGQAGLRKVRGLQGPIDDAFMDSFIFVRPTGKAMNEVVGAWAKAELDRAIGQWREVYRGDARVVDDTAVTPEMIAASSLVLWGDPQSNRLLARVLPNLPLRWNAQTIQLGREQHPAASHAPVLIYPNPLNPRRYVVLNSSFTFRVGNAQSNARQTPWLPDWALVDLRTPPTARHPGAITSAGFFDEAWRMPEQ